MHRIMQFRRLLGKNVIRNKNRQPAAIMKSSKMRFSYLPALMEQVNGNSLA